MRSKLKYDFAFSVQVGAPRRSYSELSSVEVFNFQPSGHEESCITLKAALPILGFLKIFLLSHNEGQFSIHPTSSSQSSLLKASLVSYLLLCHFLSPYIFSLLPPVMLSWIFLLNQQCCIFKTADVFVSTS